MQEGVYRVLLDGKWSLEDLTNFSRVYFQNYSFIYCLDSSIEHFDRSRIESVLKQYELRDGLSYVNIYDIFRTHIQKEDRPQIEAIQYASPGWLDLVLNVDVALQVAKVIGIYLGTPVAIAGTYKSLHKIFTGLQEQRKKYQRNSMKLDAEKAAYAQKLTHELAKGLGFENIEQLDAQTKDVEESAKLIMAHYRRISKIAKFVQAGKAGFPVDDDEQS